MCNTVVAGGGAAEQANRGVNLNNNVAETRRRQYRNGNER